MICDEAAVVTRPAVVGCARIDIGQWISPGGAESQLTLCEASAIGKLVPTLCMCMLPSTVEESVWHSLCEIRCEPHSGPTPKEPPAAVDAGSAGLLLSRNFQDKDESCFVRKQSALFGIFLF